MAESTDAEVIEPVRGIRARLKAAAIFVATPQAIATFSLLSGAGLAIAGVYVLAGTGLALLAGAFPLLLLAAVLIRGLIRAG